MYLGSKVKLKLLYFDEFKYKINTILLKTILITLTLDDYSSIKISITKISIPVILTQII